MKFFLALFIFTINQATASQGEECIDQSMKTVVRLYGDRMHGLRQIELYQDGKLVERDPGPFRAVPCHVDGSLYKGKVFTYGGCHQFGESDVRFLMDRQTGESFDLRAFACYSF